MTTEELLWRDGGGRPRRGLSLEAVVRAGIEVADAEGLAGLSMRRIAERLGFTTMSLYRHVPGRDELVELMRDAVMAELQPAPPSEPGDGAGWREALETYARQGWELRRRHLWLAEIRGTRRLPGPHAVAWYDYALGALEGTGLTPAETVAAVDLVGRFVEAQALALAEVAAEERDSGVSEQEWWGSRDSFYERLYRYPAITRLWRSGAWDEQEDAFTFGLARLLDGIELLIRSRDKSRDERCRVCGGPVEQPASGRPRAYCSHACRQRAYRDRRNGR